MKPLADDVGAMRAEFAELQSAVVEAGSAAAAEADRWRARLEAVASALAAVGDDPEPPRRRLFRRGSNALEPTDRAVRALQTLASDGVPQGVQE